MMSVIALTVSLLSIQGVFGKDVRNMHFHTKAVHAGVETEHNNYGVVPPIALSTTYIQSYPGVKPGQNDPASYGQGFFYSRQLNPNRGTLERAIAETEDAKHCALYASGMAAIHAVIQLLDSGDHVIASNDLYGGTTIQFRNIVSKTSNINFSFLNLDNLEAIEKAITPKTKMIWLESPTNPLLHTTDIAKIATFAHKHNLLVVVDNTFLSPYLQNPLALGADIIVHSLTKFIGGHSDVIMGAAVTNDDEINKKWRLLQNFGGAVPSPFDCYLALRGLKTLPLRVEQAQKNAMAIATAIQTHPLLEKIIYPGLPTYPQYEIAQRQARGPGAMITIYVKGGLPIAAKFLQSLKIFGLAVSLGAVESLACSPAIMTHGGVPKADREAIGLTDSLIRLAIGVEHSEDLIADMMQALDAAHVEYLKLTPPSK